MGTGQQALLSITTGPIPAFDFEADVGLGLSNNDPVALWGDQSPNANNATQATAGAKPTFKSTGGPGGTHPCIDFDGGDYLTLASSIPGQDLTVLTVFKYSDTNPRTIVSGGTGSFQLRTYLNKMNALKSGIADLGSESTTLSTGTFYQGAAIYDGPSAAAFYLNGVADGTASFLQTLTTNILNIGRTDNSGGSEYFLGSICMVKLYALVLNASQLSTEFAAISSRWGV